MRLLLIFILTIAFAHLNSLKAQREYTDLAQLVKLDPKVDYVLIKLEIPILSGESDSKYFYEINGKYQLTDSWSSLILEDGIEGRLKLYKLACIGSILDTFGLHSSLKRLLPDSIVPYVYGCPNGFPEEVPDRMEYLISNLITLNHRAFVWLFFPVGKKEKPIFAAYDIIWSDPGKVAPDFPLVFTDFIDVSTQKHKLIQDSLFVNQYFEGLNYIWKAKEGQAASGAFLNINRIQISESWSKSLNQGVIPQRMFKKYFQSQSKN
jgi:hypothetical protein